MSIENRFPTMQIYPTGYPDLSEPAGALYGQIIRWTDFDGSKTTVSVNGFETLEEARAAAVRSAKDSGWTPPRWWQWWRWEDTRIDG